MAESIEFSEFVGEKVLEQLPHTFIDLLIEEFREAGNRVHSALEEPQHFESAQNQAGAIQPVHLYGCPASVPRLRQTCGTYDAIIGEMKLCFRVVTAGVEEEWLLDYQILRAA